MTEAQLSAWGMKIGLSVLVIFIGFIIWDLGKKSGASKFGMAVLFFVLGLFDERSVGECDFEVTRWQGYLKRGFPKQTWFLRSGNETSTKLKPRPHIFR